MAKSLWTGPRVFSRRNITKVSRGTCSNLWRSTPVRISVSHYSSIVESKETRDNVSFDQMLDKQPGSRLSALRSNTKPFSEFLTDTFQRQHDYLRISITEKCNLRCLYCMPADGVQLSPNDRLLTPQEIIYLAALFVSQGVTKIRLTGGEPTVHPQILPILRELGALRPHGLKELALTTNGITLPRKLDSMLESGVTGINLSLDTLDPFQFQIMTRRLGFEKVMESIDRILEAKRCGAAVKLKINTVLIRGLNESQVLPFVELTRTKDLEVRFIEYMPFDGNQWASHKMLPYRDLLNIIEEQHGMLERMNDDPSDTSKTYQVPGYRGRIGFITSMTDHFCGTCNRLRITSDGNLKVCLFGNSEVSLRDMLRSNFNNGNAIDAEAWEAIKEMEMTWRDNRYEASASFQEKERHLLEVIGRAVKNKKAQHAGLGVLEHMKNRPMILIVPVGSKQTRFKRASLQCPTTSNLSPSNLLNTAPSRLLCDPRTAAFGTSISRFYSTGRCILQSLPLQQPSEFSNACVTERSLSTSSSNHKLTHLNEDTSEVHMVTIPAAKPTAQRIARAVARIIFSDRTVVQQIKHHSLKKGDVLSVARIAGIMAAKRTSNIIPLCHNIPLSGVDLSLGIVDANSNTMTAGPCSEIDPNMTDQAAVVNPGLGHVDISAEVSTVGQTGVEMEALTAVTAAALTVYDMCKSIDKGMIITDVRLIMKSGGQTGTWQNGKHVSRS